MPTITLPDAWALVAPCGCTDGLTVAVVGDRILRPDAESAWKMFTPLKRDRDREVKQGYRIEARYGQQSVGADCTHDPKWGIATSSDAGGDS